MEQLSFTEKSGDNLVTLDIKGAINSYTFSEFQTKIYELIKKTNVCLNMQNVTNLSSAGLGVLMTALEDGQDCGHKLFILSPSEVVKMAIESTGFGEMFSIIRSAHEISI